MQTKCARFPPTSDLHSGFYTCNDKIIAANPLKAAVMFKMLINIFQLSLQQRKQAGAFSVVKAVLLIDLPFIMIPRVKPADLVLDLFFQKLPTVFER